MYFRSLKLLTFALVCNSISFAGPTNPEAIQGTMEIDQSQPNRHLITLSEGAFLYWDDFSIDEDELVDVIQPSAESIAIFEVVKNVPSSLLGTLRSNGNIFLTNTNGISIGEDGYIETAGFLGSSLPGCPCPLINKDFDVSIQGDSTALIVNQGRIKATSGDIYLIGHQLINQGAIDAPQGVASLAAGENIVLNQSNGQKVGVIPSPMKMENEDTGVDNSGMIYARKVEVKADGNSYGNAILHVGLINAIGPQAEVYLVAEKGNTILHGGVSADSGDVRILGNNIFLFKNSVVNVSGDNGGGTISIGTGSDGKDAKEINAKITFIDEGVKLDLDAIEEGDGGRAKIYAIDSLVFYGSVSATGGDLSGNGGDVEIFGECSIDFQGIADCSSPNGTEGMLHLSPN